LDGLTVPEVNAELTGADELDARFFGNTTLTEGVLWQAALEEAAKILVGEDCTTDDMFLGTTTGGSNAEAIGDKLGFFAALFKTTAEVEVAALFLAGRPSLLVERLEEVERIAASSTPPAAVSAGTEAASPPGRDEDRFPREARSADCEVSLGSSMIRDASEFPFGC
jgi:hypothetical protein